MAQRNPRPTRRGTCHRQSIHILIHLYLAVQWELISTAASAALLLFLPHSELVQHGVALPLQNPIREVLNVAFTAHTRPVVPGVSASADKDLRHDRQ